AILPEKRRKSTTPVLRSHGHLALFAGNKHYCSLDKLIEEPYSYLFIKGRMVVYNLVCKKNHQFEGWFPSFEDFQKQADKKLISCPTCGSKRVEKVPHACAVHVKKEEPAPPKKAEQPAATPPTPPSPAEFKEMLLQVHHYVRQN